VRRCCFFDDDSALATLGLADVRATLVKGSLSATDGCCRRR
jgi:hypothetical protein